MPKRRANCRRVRPPKRTTALRCAGIHDQPLLDYLGGGSAHLRFARAHCLPVLNCWRRSRRSRLRPGMEHANRLGVLLGARITRKTTKTLTHVMWSLLNSIGVRIPFDRIEPQLRGFRYARRSARPRGKFIRLRACELDANVDPFGGLRGAATSELGYTDRAPVARDHNRRRSERGCCHPDAGLYTDACRHPFCERERAPDVHTAWIPSAWIGQHTSRVFVTPPGWWREPHVAPQRRRSDSTTAC